MMKDRVKLILVGVCVLIAGICYCLSRPDTLGGRETVFLAAGQSDAVSSGAEQSDAGQPGTGQSDIGQSDAGETGTQQNDVKPLPESSGGTIFVHVCGEVAAPGVYEFEQGSRVYQAVERAGGYTENAAADFLNMAQTVSDGMKLTVPDKETAKELLAGQIRPGQVQTGQVQPGSVDGTGGVFANGGSESEGSSAKININTAAKEQLMTLKGIGEARAEDIISYRQLNGPFDKIEDIMNVSGIKEAAFQKIRENITV